jgi:hypothetical protein
VPATSSYDYAIIRIVPHVERGECINVGVIFFCRTCRFLGASIHVDEQRLLALAADLDLLALRQQLEHIICICEGRDRGGPIAQLSQPERFHWLISPRSTIIQSSPVHSGLCSNPAAALQNLVRKLVL